MPCQEKVRHCLYNILAYGKEQKKTSCMLHRLRIQESLLRILPQRCVRQCKRQVATCRSTWHLKSANVYLCLIVTSILISFFIPFSIPLLFIPTCTMSPVNNQPSLTVMNSTKNPEDHENPSHAPRHTHNSCHYTRLRRLAIPGLLVLVATAALLFLELSDLDFGVGATGGLLRRAATDSTNGSSSGFVKNKRASRRPLPSLILIYISTS